MTNLKALIFFGLMVIFIWFALLFINDANEKAEKNIMLGFARNNFIAAIFIGLAIVMANFLF
jgi:hypothetical protein